MLGAIIKAVVTRNNFGASQLQPNLIQKMSVVRFGVQPYPSPEMEGQKLDNGLSNL